MRNKNLLSVLGVLVLAVIVYIVWATFMKAALITKQGDGTATVCTLDATQCPDGSWVGRSGPNCQFVCPTGASPASNKNSITLQTVIGQEVAGLNIRITPLEVVEDSRCPIDVQCIQAGTVKVRATLVGGLGSASQIFTLNTPVTTESEKITLISVSPEKESKKTIASADYRFTFTIVKK